LRLDEEHSDVRLGADVAVAGEISARRLKKLHAAAAQCASTARSWQLDRFDVIATHAIRSAANRTQALDLLESACGTPPRVLQPSEEGYLAALGAYATDPWDCPTAVVDIGGGSVQVTIADQRRVRWTGCAEIGTGTLGPRLRAATIPERDLGRYRCSVAQTISDALGPPLDLGRFEVRLAGGAMRRLGRVLGCNATVSSAVFAEAHAYLGLGQAAAGVRHGLAPRKLGLLRAGTLIGESVLTWLGARSCRFVSGGIREGSLVAGAQLPLPIASPPES
jgi:exopolyphosphatase/pppGpp-phosphohydrolase